MLQSAVKINHWFTAAHIVMAGVTIVEQMLEFDFIGTLNDKCVLDLFLN